MSGLVGGRRRLSTWQMLIKKHPNMSFEELSRIYHGKPTRVRGRSRKGTRKARRSKSVGGCGNCGGTAYTYFGGREMAQNPYIDYYKHNSMSGAGRRRGKSQPRKNQIPECKGFEIYQEEQVLPDGRVIPGFWYCPQGRLGTVRTSNKALAKEIEKRKARSRKEMKNNEQAAIDQAAMAGVKYADLALTDSYRDSIGNRQLEDTYAYNMAT